MEYITGIHALNLPCKLNTCGDWHRSAIQWERPTMRNSKNSVFGDFGIEQHKQIPNHDDLFNVADHIRCLLDMLEEGNFALAQGMNNDFICNEEYDDIIFRKILLLKESKHWEGIDEFMKREYRLKWVHFNKRSST